MTFKATRFIKETVELRDGRSVVLRPIRPEDAPRLMALHVRLSSDSQYLRFFGPKPELTLSEAEYLAGVDFNRRFAIVATVDEDDDEAIVAVGRFDMVAPGVAEPAIVVRDDHQGSGLGTTVLERMLDVARGRGVDRFQGEVLAENDKMLQILVQHGLTVGAPEDGIVRISVEVTDKPFPIRALDALARSTSAIVERSPLRRRRD